MASVLAGVQCRLGMMNGTRPFKFWHARGPFGMLSAPVGPHSRKWGPIGPIGGIQRGLQSSPIGLYWRSWLCLGRMKAGHSVQTAMFFSRPVAPVDVGGACLLTVVADWLGGKLLAW